MLENAFTIFFQEVVLVFQEVVLERVDAQDVVI